VELWGSRSRAEVVAFLFQSAVSLKETALPASVIHVAFCQLASACRTFLKASPGVLSAKTPSV
jgi:hypothetical protein